MLKLSETYCTDFYIREDPFAMALSSDTASVMIVSHMSFLINVNTCKSCPKVYKNTKIAMGVTFLREVEISKICSVE